MSNNCTIGDCRSGMLCGLSLLLGPDYDISRFAFGRSSHILHSQAQGLEAEIRPVLNISQPLSETATERHTYLINKHSIEFVAGEVATHKASG